MAVNSLGMCWVMTIGTLVSRGIAAITSRSACGPPVDDPIAIRLGLRAGARGAPRRATGAGRARRLRRHGAG
jgi:hypothetical protein